MQWLHDFSLIKNKIGISFLRGFRIFPVWRGFVIFCCREVFVERLGGFFFREVLLFPFGERLCDFLWRGCIIYLLIGCVTFLSKGCVILLSKGCVIFLSRGCVIFLSRGCAIVLLLKGCMIYFCRGCVIFLEKRSHDFFGKEVP